MHTQNACQNCRTHSQHAAGCHIVPRARFEKVCRFCSDGDSTFTGRLNSVSVRLRRGVLDQEGIDYENALPWLICVHCCAHRCALVISDVAKIITSLKKIDLLLRRVHNFFAHSTGKLGTWTAYAIKNNIKFPMFNATRWFSRALCIKVLTENWAVLGVYLLRYESLVAQKSLSAWDEGSKVLKMLKNSQLVATLLVERDLIAPLEFLSKSFQGTSSLLPHKIKDLVDNTKKSLKEISHEQALSGTHFQTWSDRVTSSDDASHSVFGSAALGFEMTGVYDVAALKSLSTAFVEASEQGLDDRLSAASLLQEFKFLDPASYRGLSLQQLADFGNIGLGKLVSHFCCGTSILPLKFSTIQLVGSEEFPRLKHRIYLMQHMQGLTMAGAWSDIITNHPLEFPNLIPLALIALCHPIETVWRGGSASTV